jgi:hypothetical protein
MRPSTRACVAIVAAISMATGGTWPLVAHVRAASQPQAVVSPVDAGTGHRIVLPAIGRSEKDRMESERARLAERLAATERLVAEGRVRYTDRGRLTSARLKRVIAILEVTDVPLSERSTWFQQLGISRSYRGADLIVSVRDSLRTVSGLGAPVHPSQLLKRHDVPDGVSVAGREEFEWEQDWEDAQTEAEDTVVAIQALEAEANAWIVELESVEADLDTLEGDTTGCNGPAPSDAPAGMNCASAIMMGLSELATAIVLYAQNSALVNAALANARAAITTALALFTGGMLTLAALGEAAIAAITALVGAKVLGWVAAAAAALLTAALIVEIIDECDLLPVEPLARICEAH